MPWTIQQGSTVEFTAAFLDSGGSITVPTSATLTMTYTTVAGATASSAVGMSAAGSFFTATWPSAQSGLGFANFSISAPGQSTPTTGQLRIVQD